ncbi:MAG: PaaX family transcriptional regulator C-terminal domain-containing protein [Actinomycetota bacterium]
MPGPGDVALAPVLGTTRAGAVSAESSRDLLITVLGELMAPSGGTAWTQTLTATLDLLGIQDKAARQAIGRLHDRGWLRRERVGRQTRQRLTDHSRRLLTDGAARIYGFGHTGDGWDGRWSIVLASVPEAKRNLRYRLTVGLTWAGFGSLGQGTWISPWPSREPEAARVLAELGVEGAAAFRAELGQVGTPKELAARAWDLAEIDGRYRAFLAELAATPLPGPAGDDDPAAAVRQLVLLVHRWRRFPFLDPDLPAELLPADWPGHRAAAAFGERRAAWGPAAAAWWAETDARFDPDG